MTLGPDFFLKTAVNLSEYGTCSRLKVGAVLVSNNRIVATGYNGVAKGLTHCYHFDNNRCSKSVHAEMNALIFAGREGIRTKGTTMYVTHAPCGGCAGPMINAGVKEVFFIHHYRSTCGIEDLHAAGIKVTQFEERWL